MDDAEQIIRSFSKILNEKPELFQGEPLQDLPQLEIAFNHLETEPESEQIESIAQAIFDFCEFNPEIQDHLRANVSSSSRSQDTPITEDTLFSLGQKINKILDSQQLTRSEI